MSGDASRSANVTGDQLAERIAAVRPRSTPRRRRGWRAAADAQQPLQYGDGDEEDQLPGGGDGPGGGCRGGWPR